MTAQPAKSFALRLGIIIDSFVQPRWVRKAVENVTASGVATFELVVKVPPAANTRESLLYRLYNRMDRRMFPVPTDALEPVSIEDLVGAVPGLGPDVLCEPS